MVLYFAHRENLPSILPFFSTLIKLEPRLSQIRAIGTDGEQTLVNAILAAFSEDVIHLRCLIHMRDNIQRNLVDLLIPEPTRISILRDNIWIPGMFGLCKEIT